MDETTEVQELTDLDRARELVEQTMTQFSQSDRTLWTQSEVDQSLDALLEVWTILHDHELQTATPA